MKIIQMAACAQTTKGYPDNLYVLTDDGKLFHRHAGKNGEWKEIDPPKDKEVAKPN